MALTNETPNEADAVAGGVANAAAGKAKRDRTSKAGARSAPEAGGSSHKTAAASKATKSKIKPAAQAAATKASIVLKKLSSPKGVTIDDLGAATGWQAHSVRGFLSAVVKKKLGLNLASEIDKDGVRLYRVEGSGKAK